LGFFSARDGNMIGARDCALHTGSPVNSRVESATTQSAERQSLRILYVEDNDLVRDITHQILSQPSRTVVAVASAEEALELFKPDAFDVVVTDVSLPAMSGLDLARRLLQRAPTVPVIIATGYSLPIETIALGERARVITKPFEPDEIDQLLNELCPSPGL
jgi:two-component system cell cycle response regulator CpdR